jgi:hypothetical protein
MGPVADDLRASLQHALTNPDAAERLYQLMPGEPLVEEPAIDRELLMAGLLRRARGIGVPRVELRTPAIALAF